MKLAAAILWIFWYYLNTVQCTIPESSLEDSAFDITLPEEPASGAPAPVPEGKYYTAANGCKSSKGNWHQSGETWTDGCKKCRCFRHRELCSSKACGPQGRRLNKSRGCRQNGGRCVGPKQIKWGMCQGDYTNNFRCWKKNKICCIAKDPTVPTRPPTTTAVPTRPPTTSAVPTRPPTTTAAPTRPPTTTTENPLLLTDLPPDAVCEDKNDFCATFAQFDEYLCEDSSEAQDCQKFCMIGACKPKCDPGCNNGECVGKDTCRCNRGWDGTFCNVTDPAFMLYTSSPPQIDTTAASTQFSGETVCKDEILSCDFFLKFEHDRCTDPTKSSECQKTCKIGPCAGETVCKDEILSCDFFLKFEHDRCTDPTKSSECQKTCKIGPCAGR